MSLYDIVLTDPHRRRLSIIMTPTSEADEIMAKLNKPASLSPDNPFYPPDTCQPDGGPQESNTIDRNTHADVQIEAGEIIKDAKKMDMSDYDEIESVNSSENDYPEDGNQTKFRGLKPVGLTAVTANAFRQAKDMMTNAPTGIFNAVPPRDEITHQCRIKVARWGLTREYRRFYSPPISTDSLEPGGKQPGTPAEPPDKMQSQLATRKTKVEGFKGAERTSPHFSLDEAHFQQLGDSGEFQKPLGRRSKNEKGDLEALWEQSPHRPEMTEQELVRGMDELKIYDEKTGWVGEGEGYDSGDSLDTIPD
ncbi:MAG: hypothetical protein M1814_003391 [Vezdaea aestivalis]|nr:MAG: hypothetical protein M1814_003391 [Vezdaea aestivalis]